MNHQFLNYILIGCGILSVALGALGVVLPLLPTTPFLLIAVYCFAKSSDKCHKWLLNHPILGKYIYNYTVHKAISKKAKFTAIIMIWVTLSISMLIADRLLVTGILTFIGTSVSIHLLRFKTLDL